MRPSWEEYALGIADAAAVRSEDPDWQVGAVAIRHDNSVASVGYNGTVPGLDFDWSNSDYKRPRAIHAERNALRYCKPGEVKFIAVNVMPCARCLTDIASYGIKKVVYSKEYKEKEAVERLAKDFGIELVRYDRASTDTRGKTTYRDCNDSKGVIRRIWKAICKCC